jgi:hypothetical protein
MDGAGTLSSGSRGGIVWTADPLSLSAEFLRLVRTTFVA